jgi:hypothetical protein
MQPNSLWKEMLAAVVLVLFVAIGLAHVVYPEWFVGRSSVRKGGEMLTEWNRLGFQFAGVVFAAFAIYGLYILFR